jgi:hypothetical protein
MINTQITLDESIFFYTRNNYMIINSLLSGNTDKCWAFAEMVNADCKAVLAEHKSGERSLDKRYIEWYERRLYNQLDEAAKDKIIAAAHADCVNIMGAMYPAQEEMLLYRTVWCVREESILPEYKIGAIAEFPIISSTSLTPYLEHIDSPFYRYEIRMSAGCKILELDRFDPFIRNEDGEVLLPPMRCEITGIRPSDNPNCKAVVELTYNDGYTCDKTEFIKSVMEKARDER